jgi:hypothetical protein
MSASCAPFRAELERALAGPGGALARMTEDAHVHSCPGCRAELARELGLERLLERVPAPEIPPELAQRVLVALAGERGEGRLSGLTTRSTFPTAGALGADDLDVLLERVPAPNVPAGLAQRVLRGVEPARARRSRRSGALVLAAAAVLILVTLWAWTVGRDAGARRGLPSDAELELDEELLAYAVERWELLHDEDLDVWLASVDPLDELLMGYAEGEAWLEPLLGGSGADGARPEREGR